MGLHGNSIGRFSLLCVITTYAATMLPSCTMQDGTTSSVMPSNSGAYQARRNQARVRSWMQASASSQDLVYISSSNANVYVYTYPQGKRVGTLTGFGGGLSGECVDATGDVFIPAAGNATRWGTIYEYAHGGSNPIATLNDPGVPDACSVDPATGNLAVANTYDPSNPYNPSYGSIAVYTSAKGSAKSYYPTKYSPYFCGYDDKENLYFSAFNPNIQGWQLIRLARQSNSFESIDLKTKLYANYQFFRPSVQWDGQHMTVTSLPKTRGALLVYRLVISGRKATVIGTTKLVTSWELQNRRKKGSPESVYRELIRRKRAVPRW